MPNLSGWEIVVIVLVIALLFGAKKLPDAARGIGRSLRIFKAEVGIKDDDETETVPPAATTAPPAAITSTATPPVPQQPVSPAAPAPVVASPDVLLGSVTPPLDRPVSSPVGADGNPAER